MPEIVGLLLAAGRGSRFDPSGVQSKLLQALPDGRAVAVAAAQSLRASVTRVVALVPADTLANTRALAQHLAAAGCEVLPCPASALGMGHTLAAGVAASMQATGWLVLPADMPWVAAASCGAIAQAVAAGADAAAPVYHGQRGHPVGFGQPCRDALMALGGDVGARSVLAQYPPRLIEVADEGVLRDIDTPDALSPPASSIVETISRR